MRKALCAIFLLFASILPLASQTDAAAEKRAGAGRSAWFACTSQPEGMENPVKLMSGKEITQLELPKFMASDPVKIPADGVLRIVREVPDPANPGRMRYLVLAEAKIPENICEALIILGPLPQPKGDLVFQAHVQDLAKFKSGDRLYINLSDTNIGVKIGEISIAVPAKQSNIYSLPNLVEPVSKPIRYQYHHPEEKKWKTFGSSVVAVIPTRREICVFNNGTGLGRIERHGILFPVRAPNP